PAAIEGLDFIAPTGVHVVGSFLLRTLARPALSVDIAVEMPAECLHHKDFLNHKYLQKRQLFLSRIAEALSAAGIGEVSFACFRGDPRKPILVIAPAGLKGLSKKFAVNILPCLPPDLIPAARLRPTRNNVRVVGISDIAEQPPTPSYNAALAEDSGMARHAALLHAAFSACPPLTEAAVLLKVWLRQRGLAGAPDGAGGFFLSMLLALLYQA
ncbi:Nrap protein, partial [Baffinella frigidus]